MGFIDKYLGKQLEDLSFGDIENYFISPKIESDTVEYKSYFIKNQNNHNHKENAILKSICGLLNSEGGIIIWGAPVEGVNPETRKKEYKGALSLINLLIDKDSFISKISQSIVPIPSGIKLGVITNHNSCLCIFEVQKSLIKPHRYDGRYWMRLDGQTHVAPHHYVEALFKEIKYPNVEGFIILKSHSNFKSNTGGGYLSVGDLYVEINIKTYIVNFSPLINEANVLERIRINNGVFKDYRSNPMTYHSRGTQFEHPKKHEILHYGDPIITESLIVVKHSDLGNEDIIQVALEFGGEKSPFKRTMVYFKTKKEEECVKIVDTEKFENELAADFDFHSRKEFLKRIEKNDL